MWEENELFPELKKIAPLEALDLQPSLKAQPDRDPREVALECVQGFVSASREVEPDIILAYVRGGLLSEDFFSAIRKKWSCPLLGMNLDDKVNFWDYNLFSAGNENYKEWAKHFDLNLTNSLIASDWYRQFNLRCFYLAPGVRTPDVTQLPTGANFKYPVSFLGSRKPDREAIVNRLRNTGIEIAVFGSNWPSSQWIADVSKVFRSSQINLGIGYATPNLTTTKNRDFECPASGACYLTTYNWELTKWWEIGKEILCYRNVDELIEIISYYRRRPEECQRIAQAAWKRSVAEHTWEKRFREVFREIGFKD